MILGEIIKEAANIVGLNNVVRDNKNFNILFRCANLVLSNIALNYHDCIAEQKFNVTEHLIEFCQFEKPCFKIKSVKIDGKEIEYGLYMNMITVPNGFVVVEYAYIPRFEGWDDDTVNCLGKFDDSILLYGIIAEYASISGLSHEYKVYSEKFEKLLSKSARTGHARVMP
jgi:hypothetical protein